MDIDKEFVNQVQKGTSLYNKNFGCVRLRNMPIASCAEEPRYRGHHSHLQWNDINISLPSLSVGRRPDPEVDEVEPI